MIELEDLAVYSVTSFKKEDELLCNNLVGESNSSTSPVEVVETIKFSQKSNIMHQLHLRYI